MESHPQPEDEPEVFVHDEDPKLEVEGFESPRPVVHDEDPKVEVEDAFMAQHHRKTTKHEKIQKVAEAQGEVDQSKEIVTNLQAELKRLQSEHDARKEQQEAFGKQKTSNEEQLKIIKDKLETAQGDLTTAETKLDEVKNEAAADSWVYGGSVGGGASASGGTLLATTETIVARGVGAAVGGGVGIVAGVGLILWQVKRYNDRWASRAQRTEEGMKVVTRKSGDVATQETLKESFETNQATIEKDLEIAEVQRNQIAQQMSAIQDQLDKAMKDKAESEANLEVSMQQLDLAHKELAEHGNLDKFQEVKAKTEDSLLINLTTGKYPVLENVKRSSKPSIAVVGQRGHGKSSLINALARQAVCDVGAVDTTLSHKKVCEFESVEFYDSPGDTQERSVFNLAMMAMIKKVHMVLVLYDQDVLQCLGLVRACAQLGVPCIIVRNMRPLLPSEAECKETCSRFQKVCQKCVYNSDKAKLQKALAARAVKFQQKLDEMKLHDKKVEVVKVCKIKVGDSEIANMTAGGEANVPIVFLQALSPDAPGMDKLRGVLHANCIQISGEVLDVEGAQACHVHLDIDYLQTLMSNITAEQDVEGEDEMFELLLEHKLMTGPALTELDNISQAKTQEWRDMGLSEEDIARRMPLYWYSLEVPSVYKPVSKVLNDVETRDEDKAVPAAMRYLKWVMDSARSVGEEFQYSGTAWRGVHYRFEDGDAWDKFQPGQIFAWYTVKSVTTNRDVLAMMFGHKNPLTIFIIEDCKGTYIGTFSHFPREEEVLVHPGSLFKVQDRVRGIGGGSFRERLAGTHWERADKITLRMLGNIFLDGELLLNMAVAPVLSE